MNDLTDATFIAEKGRIAPVVEKWVRLLGLEYHDIGTTYHDGEFWDQSHVPSGDAVATAHGRWQYMHGSIAFNCARTAPLSNADLEQNVVHELLHIVLEELHPTLPPGYYRDENDKKHEERVCQSLSFAFMRTLKEPRDE